MAQLALTPTQPLSRAARFFFEHAGFNYNPRRETPAEGKTRCAEDHADAEAAFEDAHAYASAEFKVAPDYYDSDDAADARDGQPLWQMWIEDGAGHCLASLGGVDDDSDAYRRVVRAELALECLDQLRELYAAEV